MKFYEAALDEHLLNTLICLSKDWETENSCHGYCQNGREYITGNRIFLAEEDEQILGYLLGHACQSKYKTSVMAAEKAYFEIEELYVVPQRRSMGIGGALFRFVEENIRAEGMEYILLSTAAKNYKSILHFYIEEMGMEFWSARLFKQL